MADENIQLPSVPTDSLARATEMPPVADGADRPLPVEETRTAEANLYRKSPGQLALGGALAVLVFAVCTYALFGLFVSLLGTGVLSYVAPFVITLVVFAVLERNLVLSRLFGLQTGPDSSPLRAVVSWFVPLGTGSSAPATAVAYADEQRRPTGRRPTAPATAAPPPITESKDVVREVAETVVFVVVLVLLLKTFVAEAFVIPTGSMATTLWGYQKVVTCPKCGEAFPVNCSSEVDPPSPHQKRDITGCTCPNCRYDINFFTEYHDPSKFPDYHTGDRVLVAKFLYDTHLRAPHRDDVVVFKYPVNPQQNSVAMNYIKRLVGLPHETVAIHDGKLYVTDGLDYGWRKAPPAESSSAMERLRACYVDDEKAHKLFHASQANPELAGGFRIVRKTPDVVLAMSRLVYDNDHQAKDLAGQPEMQRWQAEESWKPDDPRVPRRFDHAGPMGWLRYKHILRNSPGMPQLITDFMGYNSGYDADSRNFGGRPSLGQNWVSDLILECNVEVISVNPGDEVVLELAKGPDRFQARFTPENGDCTLVRHRTIGQVFDKVLATQPGTRLKGPGKYHVRLANVDDQLTLWVNDDLPFGKVGVAYEPAKDRGPDKENDLQPAAVGVQGNTAISQLLLRRDTYYTVDPSKEDAPLPAEAWSDPAAWKPLRERAVKTIYVQPTHYLCMGDNSPESADGRSWGLVPERLLLGRALVVYFPFYPVMRVGPIK